MAYCNDGCTEAVWRSVALGAILLFILSLICHAILYRRRRQDPDRWYHQHRHH